MKKVVFVDLYDFTSLKRMQIPLGILSLYFTIQKSRRYDVEICNFNDIYFDGILKDESFLNNIEDMARYLINKSPDMVSIYTMCNNYHVAVFLAKKLRELAPAIIIVFAGPHATMVGKETLEDFWFVDYVALGEGEQTIITFLDGVLDGHVETVNGIGYRKGNEIVCNWDRKDVVDLETIDVIDFTKVGNESDKIKALKSLDIEGGRGCPFRCAFCSTQQFWGNHFRVKSVAKIISEVEFYMQILGIRDFNFQHDLFTFKEKYIMDFCDELIQRNLNITWKCSARIDTVNARMLKRMAESGCVGIFFGVETGSKYVQKAVNKNLKLEKVDEVLAALIDNEITAVFSFIYGYPMESDSDLNDTLFMIYRIRKQAVHRKVKAKFFIELWPLAFLPGTKMGEEYYDELKFNEYRGMDFNNSDYTRCSEVDQLVKEHKKIFLNYYNIDKNSSLEFQYLNVFIMYLFNFSYAFMYQGIDLLVESYHNDILKFYFELFACERERMIKFFKNKTVGGVMPNHEEMNEFIGIIQSFLEQTSLKVTSYNNYIRIKESLGMFQYLFHIDTKKAKDDINGDEVWKALENRYPQLRLPISEGMSKSDQYKRVALRGLEVEDKQNNFVPSSEDLLIHTTFESNPVELLFIRNRENFEHFIQIMAYRCEPHEIARKSSVFTLTEVINWSKIKAHKREYLKLGGKDWEKELDSFMSNRKNYTETLIVVGFKEEDSYENICSKLQEGKEFRVYSKIKLFTQYAGFIATRKVLRKKEKILNYLLNQCIGLVSAAGEYDIEIAKALSGYEEKPGTGNSVLEKYLTEQMSMDELHKQVLGHTFRWILYVFFSKFLCMLIHVCYPPFL